MSAAPIRKYHELRRKTDNLRTELLAWRSESTDGKPLRLHQSQITSLTGSRALEDAKNEAPLAVLWREIVSKLPEKLPVDGSFLDSARETEFLLHGAHAIWNFFREKFAQRYLPAASDYLSIADEVAWACYKPALDKVSGKQSPPLTFLSAGGRYDGPAIQERGGEWISQADLGVFTRSALRSLVAPLAVPVINLPWAQCGHLPSLPVIAHEIGHAVESDFGLTKELNTAVSTAVRSAAKAGVKIGEEDRWLRWMGEIFADLHGIVHLGPAFSFCLMDLLSVSAYRSIAEDFSMDTYPTDSLRMRINAEGLRQMGFADKSQDLLKTWSGCSAEIPASPEFDAGIPEIVNALLDTPLKGLCGAALNGLGGWNDKRRRDFDDLCQQAAGKTSSDTRLVCAAMRMVYDGGEPAFFEGDRSKKQTRHDGWRDGLLRCRQPTGTRGPVGGSGVKVDLAAALRDLCSGKT